MPFAKIFLFLALLLPLGATQAQAQMSNPRAAGDLMMAAVRAQDPAAVAALYASDALVLPSNGAPIQGRDAIAQAWAGNFAGGYSDLNILQQRTESGTDRAATVMIWEATIQPQGGQAQTFRGRSLFYFTQTDDGWLISADMAQIGG